MGKRQIMNLFYSLTYSLLLGILVSTAPCAANSNIEALTATIQAATAGQPTVIATDIHNVATRRLSGDWQRFKAIPNKLTTIASIALYGAYRLAYACKLIRKPSIEAFIFKNNEPAPSPALLALISPFEPDNVVFDFLRSMQTHNAHLVAFSNIEPRSYAYMRKSYPAAFGIFNASCTPTPENNLVFKDSPDAYHRLYATAQELCKDTPPSVILYLDDSFKNLQRARAAWPQHSPTALLYTYQFTTSEQFVRDLQEAYSWLGRVSSK